MQRVLVLGGSGLVGRAVINELRSDSGYDVHGTYSHNNAEWLQDKGIQLDVNDTDSLDRLLEGLKPEIIVSCLRGDFNKQYLLHEKAAELLEKNGGKLYFYSTTNVFDNDFSTPHYEDDEPNAFSDYGRYKAECEKMLQQRLGENACILRLPQMWGKNSPRMLEIKESVGAGGTIEVYPQLLINTNTDMMVARQTSYIIKNELKGIFHLSAMDMLDHMEFYQKLINEMGYGSEYLKENLSEKGIFVLLSKRMEELPEDLRIANAAVIKYLAS